MAEIYRGMVLLGGAKGINKEPLKLEDYVLPFGDSERQKPKQSWQEKRQIAALIVAAYTPPKET